MVAIVCVLSFTALCFGVLSLSRGGLWPYYIPAALVVALLWLHVADGRNRYIARRIVRRFPNLLSADERDMFLSSPSLFIPQMESQHLIFSGRDVVSVVQMAAGIAIVYGALSAFRQAWTPAVLGIGVFLYSLLGPLASAFTASNHVDSEARAVDRCLARLRRRGGAGGEVPPGGSQNIDTRYWRTLDKLHSIAAVITQDGKATQDARRHELLSCAHRPSIPE